MGFPMFVMTAIAESRETRLMSLASPASFRRQAFFSGLKTRRLRFAPKSIALGNLILIAEQAQLTS